MLKYKYYILLIICLGFFTNANATHNRAGEITYKWLYGYTYEIKATIYTNIYGSSLADRCEETIYFGDGTMSVVFRSNGVSSLCSPPAKDGVTINAKIKLNEYVTTHTYPSAGNYKISMEDPNRSAGIINIPNSVNQVFYIESFLVIPFFGSGKNDSPVLTFPPIDNGCLNQCFYHNPGAYDIDGDSISYELTYCRGNSGVASSGYSYPSSGGGIFNLDSLTGTLTWCNPQIQGDYSLAMIIKEWRSNDEGNPFLVGYVIRDFQVTIDMCNNNPPEIIIDNKDTVIVAETTFTTNIIANDVNGNTITLTANGEPFWISGNPATFVSTPTASTTNGFFNWNTNYSNVRKMPYQITLKATDNDQTNSLIYFKTFNIKIIPDAPRSLSATSLVDSMLLTWQKPLDYTTSRTNSFLRYIIYRKTGASNWIHSNNEITPPTYTGFSPIGISNTISDTVFYDINSGNSFSSNQDYSYLVLAEYNDGSRSFVSNISTNQVTVGLKKLQLNSTNVSLFPNPVNEKLTIHFYTMPSELFTISLYDLTGRKLEIVLESNSLTEKTDFYINTEKLNQGIYFLKITGKNTSVTKKIIKQ